MTLSEQIKNLYEGENGKFDVPTTLYHSIQKGSKSDVKVSGLQAGFAEWNDINEILVSRPKGIFFWGGEMAEFGYDISVKVSDLDESKIFAFPSSIAKAADQVVVCGTDDETKATLGACEGIPLKNYTGQFAAEFIYCDDIPAAKLEWSVDV